MDKIIFLYISMHLLILQEDNSSSSISSILSSTEGSGGLDELSLELLKRSSSSSSRSLASSIVLPTSILMDLNRLLVVFCSAPQLKLAAYDTLVTIEKK